MIGGGLIGCETGYWLADTGHQVHVLEMREDLAMDALPSHRAALLPRMAKTMTWNCSVTVTEVTENGVKFTSQDGQEHFLEADTVLYAVGQRANRADAQALHTAAPFVREVGDCIRPANITKAVYEGYHAALDI